MRVVNYIWGAIKSTATSFWQNSRDIVSSLLFLTGILFVTQLISVVSKTYGIDIHPVRDFVFAIGKFAAVCLCGVGYFTHVTFRESLGKLDNGNEFMDTWNNVLTAKERFDWFMKIISVGIIAAAVCFAWGV